MIDKYDDIKEGILMKHYIQREYDFSQAKNISKTEKLNEQTPLIQMYWLGKLAYNLAIRNKEVIKIEKELEKKYLNNQKEKFVFENYPSEYIIERILRLEKYGFNDTFEFEEDILAPEHTTFPTYLKHNEYGKILINTIFKIEQLLDIIDGAPKSKYSFNNNNFERWKKIGNFYTSNTNHIKLLKIY